MPGGLTELTQASFAAGMFQAPDTQRIPDNGAYDILNGLLDVDEGVVYRRGGGAYLSNALGITPTRIWDAYLAAGARTMLTEGTGLYVLAADDLTASADPTSFQGTHAFDRRPGIGQGIAWFPVAGTIFGYAGFRGLGSNYSTGTISISQGSSTVTGVGTTFVGNVQPGYILDIGTPAQAVGSVRSVDSNTQLTLDAPFTRSATATTFTASAFLSLNVVNLANLTGTMYAIAAGGRLVLARANQVVFMDLASVPIFALGTTTNFHQLPGGAQVIGLEAIRDTVLVFTDRGVYTISNLALDLTDAYGNPQQRLDYLSELVLVDSNGLANYRNALIVPATDDIYLMDAGSTPVVISRPIRTLYRSYVRSGYTVGQSAVYRGHFILPILNGNTWVDTLICELSSGAWTRASGVSGQSVGHAVRVGATTRQPELLSIQGSRVLDCSAWWVPTAANKNEADGTTHTFQVITKDYTLGSLRGLVKKVRLWLEGVDAAADGPIITSEVASGLPGSPFTSLSGSGSESTGDTPFVFPVNTGGHRVRFRFASTDPWASLKLKALDLFVRPKGRA